MTKLYDTWLMFQIHDTEISRDEALGGILVAHDKGDEAMLKKEVDEYWKMDRAVQLGYEMLLVGELSEWDWVWAAKNGHLCQKDFEWFAEDLAKSGVKSYEDFMENWYKPEKKN